MKNSNDAIGNRTCDLPACSAVLQPTVPLRENDHKDVFIMDSYKNTHNNGYACSSTMKKTAR
jgi:hypothetical protein